MKSSDPRASWPRQLHAPGQAGRPQPSQRALTAAGRAPRCTTRRFPSSSHRAVGRPTPLFPPLRPTTPGVHRGTPSVWARRTPGFVVLRAARRTRVRLEAAMPEGKGAFREVLPKQGTAGGRDAAAGTAAGLLTRARAALSPPQGSCRWRTRPAWCCASPRCCPSSRCRWRSWSSCSARPWRRRGRPRALRAPSRGPRRGARYRPRAPEPPFVPFFPRSYTANAAPGGGFHHGAPRLCPGRLQRAERLRLRRSTERDGHSGAVTRCDTDPSLLRKGSLSPHRKFVLLV